MQEQKAARDECELSEALRKSENTRRVLHARGRQRELAVRTVSWVMNRENFVSNHSDGIPNLPPVIHHVLCHRTLSLQSAMACPHLHPPGNLLRRELSRV